MIGMQLTHENLARLRCVMHAATARRSDKPGEAVMFGVPAIVSDFYRRGPRARCGHRAATLARAARRAPPAAARRAAARRPAHPSGTHRRHACGAALSAARPARGARAAPAIFSTRSSSRTAAVGWRGRAPCPSRLRFTIAGSWCRG
jgi:hypothetical protein